MIKLKNVTKELKGKSVLSNINMELNAGECVAVVGHNGCGKTMLLRMICGLIKPDSGEVITDDYRYGVIIENPSFFQNETAMYNLQYLASINKLIGRESIENVLKEYNLYHVRNKKVKTFSLGMKQRLALCQAFMENPDVLLLDEPFNAIDDKNLQITYDNIRRSKEAGKIIVIATHGIIPKECSVDRVIKMNEGEIVGVEGL
ncbi:MAG: ABC transporter ATP-binding protein [Lachnospira sp.]|nr:ABC transporter ATP-binding protein [Lachnospira sp.]